MDWDPEKQIATISAAMFGTETYILGSDVTAFIRNLSAVFREDACDYAEEGEREAALAVAEIAILLEKEADSMDVSLMEVANFDLDEAADG